MSAGFTKHYVYGLLAGMGIDLFIAGMLARSRGTSGLGLLVPVGVVVAATGRLLYALDRRGTAVKPPDGPV